MRRFSTESVCSTGVNLRTGVLSVVAMALALVTLIPTVGSAQQIPPRIYQLQEHRKIVPTPPSNADRLRRDIVNATNPNGTLDVRRLRRPTSVWSDWRVEERGGLINPRTSPQIWSDWGAQQRGSLTGPPPSGQVWDNRGIQQRGTLGGNGPPR
jgi:hypothetical protein